jgi:hypothetical protein
VPAQMTDTCSTIFRSWSEKNVLSNSWTSSGRDGWRAQKRYNLLVVVHCKNHIDIDISNGCQVDFTLDLHSSPYPTAIIMIWYTNLQ